MTNERKVIIERVQKLVALATSERKIGNREAANTIDGKVQELTLKYSITRVEITGKVDPEPVKNSNRDSYSYKSESVEDIFADYYNQTKQQSSHTWRSHNPKPEQKEEKTYRYKILLKADNDPTSYLRTLCRIYNVDVESLYVTPTKNFWGKIKFYNALLTVTGTHNFLKIFKARIHPGDNVITPY